MLLDKVEVTFHGGRGGNGKVSFVKMGRGPDGGNGGNGGDLYIRAESDLTLLNQFSRKVVFAAGDAVPGGSNKRSGRNGEDLELVVPVGTSIVKRETGEVIMELDTVGERKLLAKGGRGGRGNWEFRSPILTTPKFAEQGTEGQKVDAILNLKLIADFGLVGLPNVGKSSLLNEITNAKAVTANYHFTTLSPNLGVHNKKIIADIPGLIEGASSGKGLGTSFLKHIEKVKVLIHCIAADSPNPLTDYKVVRKEMGEFNKELLEKKEIIVITKSDVVEKKDLAKVVKLFKAKADTVLPISIHDFDSIKNLQSLLA